MIEIRNIDMCVVLIVVLNNLYVLSTGEATKWIVEIF